tara:strand:+ start:4740 stop:5597 length:858 start_codon:yes stop_codon:yes gene_type:complete
MVNVIGIGFSRTGSTWLSKCLEEHPEICFSKEKETHFFNLDARYKEGIDAYHANFDCADEKVVAEFTAVYTREGEKVAPRIHAYNPDARLLVMLRNPAERAFSNYTYRKARVGGQGAFIDIVKEKGDLINEGLYAKHLAPFFNLFPKKQFVFIIQEESRENPRAIIQEVYESLGVDASFTPSCIGKEINASKDHAYYLAWFQHGIQHIRVFMHKSIIFAPLRTFAKISGITKSIAYLQHLNARSTKTAWKESIDPALKKELMEYYEEDIRVLEKNISRTLDIWRK